MKWPKDVDLAVLCVIFNNNHDNSWGGRTGCSEGPNSVERNLLESWALWLHICFIRAFLLRHPSIHPFQSPWGTLLGQILCLPCRFAGKLLSRLFLQLSKIRYSVWFTYDVLPLCGLATRLNLIIFLFMFLDCVLTVSCLFLDYIWHSELFSQLLLSSWKGSFIPGVCGLLAGFLYKSNILGIKKVKVGH